MTTPVLDGIALGAIQGLTQVLPLSSDGHLALAHILFHTAMPSRTMGVVLHTGALAATLLVFRHRVRDLLVAFVGGIVRPRGLRASAAGRDVLFIAEATFATAAVGLLVRDAVTAFEGAPLVVALGFLVTGALLVACHWAPPGKVEQPGLGAALLMGFAQGVAVLPGLSRTGSTIVVALFLGVRPDRAFELSVLMAVPAVLGAMLLEAGHVSDLAPDAVALAVGVVVSFVLGLAALGLLRRALLRGFFPLFALWVVPLGLATMALAWAWPERY
jgi:undecaprenyl-diphosphatase